MVKWTIYAIGFACVLGLWQFLGTASQSARLLCSTPYDVIIYGADHWYELIHAMLITLGESVGGLVVANVVAFSLVITCLYVPRLESVIVPVAVAVQVIPLVVFAPFAVIAFGIGYTSKVTLAAIICFFPILLNFFAGYRTIPQNVHDLLDIYGASRSFRIFHVYFRITMPFIFAGQKVAASLAVLGAVVAEFTGAYTGIGKNIFLTTVRIEPELMVLSVFLCGVIGGVMVLGVSMIERILGKWYF